MGVQFPIGIDPERFIAALETDVVKSHVAELRARFAGRKVGPARVQDRKGVFCCRTCQPALVYRTPPSALAAMWDGVLGGAPQVMLGVDRLDMIKGIPQKLLAFEKFLEENQHWRDKVLLVQIAVPTRTDVSECTPPSPPPSQNRNGLWMESSMGGIR